MTDSARYREIVDTRRSSRGSVQLELGCGAHKVNPDAIGIDVLAAPGVDIVGDAYEVLAALEPGSVDEIFSRHFLEHIADPRAMLAACARVLRAGGSFRAIIPHFSNPHFYSDPTHDRAYGLLTFSYLVTESFTSIGVPHYEEPLPFRYRNATYVFKSNRPHYVRHGFKQVGRIFNINTWMKELYEEKWCWLWPAYEVDYELERLG
jgi:ubiquinone/menaquinone biosynthesis C-methylase UbiE